MFLSSSCAFTNLHNQLMNKIWPSMQVEWLKAHHVTMIYMALPQKCVSEFVKVPVYQAESPRSRGIASTWTFKTNSRIWHHPKIIQNTSKISTNLDCSATISEIQVLKCLPSSRSSNWSNLSLQDFHWFNLTLPKTCLVSLPFSMIGEKLSHQLQTYVAVFSFSKNVRNSTGLHEFARENTAHVQVLGVGFKGFVVAQDLRRACRRHWRNQQGIPQTMLCLYPRWTAAASAGRDVGPKISRRNLRLKEKMPINFLWGDFLGGVVLEMIFCLNWKINLKVVHWQPPPPV